MSLHNSLLLIVASSLTTKMVNHVDTLRYGPDGRKTYIPLDPKELVVGDTIHVRGGDAIPADW